MNKKYGGLIGATLGKVLDVDVEEETTSWGPFLKVKVKLNLKKALARGRSIKVLGQSYWIPL